MPIDKPWDPATVGDKTIEYHSFARLLFGLDPFPIPPVIAGNTNVRDDLKAVSQQVGATDTDLRNAIKHYKVNIPPTSTRNNPLRIIVFDVERGDLYWAGNDPRQGIQDYYVFVMPADPKGRPHGHNQPEYRDEQAWESAWYHAVVDGYGM